MGQKNADTVEFRPWNLIQDSINSNVHTVDPKCIKMLRVGDIVDILEIESLNTEQVLSFIASDVEVLSINPGNNKVTFDSSFDTSGLTGIPYLKIDNIDDVQVALERALCDPSGSAPFDLRQNILDFEADKPSAGKGLYDVADVSLWRVGDTVRVIDDSGVLISSTTVFGINVNADDTNNKATIAVNDNTVIPLGANPFIQNLTINGELATKRNQERIDEIDRPYRNRLPLAQPDGFHGCFEYPELFVNGSAEVYIDGNKKFPGQAGTLASLVQGALPNGQMTFSSMILNLFGNQTQVEVVSAAGFGVTVTGNHKQGFLVQVNNNSDAATAKEICDAINADVDARKIVQAIYSGTGATAVTAFGPTNLAGGLDDSTRDYAELEQVFENKRSGTGFKFISFNIRTDLPNRMNKVPRDSEEMDIAFVKAQENQDR